MILCNPLSKNPVLPTNSEFNIETNLSLQVVFQLNSDYCTKVVTYRGLALYHTKYEAWLCYYIDAISSNSQAGQWNVGTHCYGQLDKKGNFMSFQPVCSCLSVYRHNITPHFNNLCLSQMSLPTFKLPFYKSMCQFYVMWYSTCIWNNKIYCNIVNCFCRT